MFDFKITAKNGVATFIRARDRASAIKMYCEAEGCSIEYFTEHCKIRRMREEKRDEKK